MVVVSAAGVLGGGSPRRLGTPLHTGSESVALPLLNNLFHLGIDNSNDQGPDAPHCHVLSFFFTPLLIHVIEDGGGNKRVGAATYSSLQKWNKLIPLSCHKIYMDSQKRCV